MPASLVLVAALVAAPFEAPRAAPAPTLRLARSSSEPPAPAPALAPAPATPAVPEEDRPATTLAEVEAEHADDPAAAESLALQPAAPETHAPGHRRPPSVWGRLWLSGSIIASPNTVGLGLGAVRFVTRRLGLGLDVEDMIVLDIGTYNLFQLTPKVVFLLLPSLRVTPIASAGFGGAFFSSRLGAYGRWVAGAGLMIAIREHLRLGFGLDVEGLLPKDRFYHHFECRGGGYGCHIAPVPWISFGFRG